MKLLSCVKNSSVVACNSAGLKCETWSRASACKIILASSLYSLGSTNKWIRYLKSSYDERILFLEDVTCNNSKGCALKKEGFSSVNIIAAASCLAFSVVFLSIRKPKH